MNEALGRVWTVAMVIYFTSSRHFPDQTEENHEKPNDSPDKIPKPK
jgi:hypothetical protein